MMGLTSEHDIERNINVMLADHLRPNRQRTLLAKNRWYNLIRKNFKSYNKERGGMISFRSYVGQLTARRGRLCCPFALVRYLTQ